MKSAITKTSHGLTQIPSKMSTSRTESPLLITERLYPTATSSKLKDRTSWQEGIALTTLSAIQADAWLIPAEVEQLQRPATILETVTSAWHASRTRQLPSRAHARSTLMLGTTA